MARNRRRLRIINREQRRAALAIGVLPTVSLAITISLVAVFCRRVLEEAQAAVVEIPSLPLLFWTLTAFVVVAELATIYQAVVISNRVSGPIVAVRRCLDRVRTGDYSSRIKLRRNDLVHEYADEINQLIDLLEQRAKADAEGARDGTDESSAPEQLLVGAGDGRTNT